MKFGTGRATIVSDSGSKIVAKSPAGTGTVDVTVQTAGGTSATSAADQFTYLAAPIVTGITPPSGPLAGDNTQVTITGKNLGMLGTATVKFGTIVESPISDSGTQIVLDSPAGKAGTVYVTVATAGGTSRTSAADKFTYAGARPSRKSNRRRDSRRAAHR